MLNPHNEPARPSGPTEPPRRRYRDPEHRVLRNWLNSAFMVATLATIVLYYALPGEENRLWFIGMGMLAVAIKMIEVVIRTLDYTRNRQPRRRYGDDED